jgi:hypothetical protein
MSIQPWSVVIYATALLFVMPAARAEPHKALYELQERCGRLAAMTFQREWGRNAGQTLATYENHYSPRLNKCFYLEIRTILPRSANESNIKHLTLYDLNENKEYGHFIDAQPVGAACEVRGKTCNSEAEWRTLAKPFLDE